MDFWYDVTCPYCGFINRVREVEPKIWHVTKILGCANEEGGCGYQFVCDVSITAEATARTIGGQKEAYQAELKELFGG